MVIPSLVCSICSGDGVGGRPLAPAAAPEAEKWEPCVWPDGNM